MKGKCGIKVREIIYFCNMASESIPKKAYKLDEVAQAVQHNLAVGPDHEFFVDFADLRGDFKEKVVFHKLNVRMDGNKPIFNPISSNQKKILFLGGMRGSGKTSELAKIGKVLHAPTCFFCVTCNMDDELDMNDVEYVDVLILQMQKLVDALSSRKVNLSKAPLKKMEAWFSARDKEAKTVVKAETGLDMGLKGTTGEGVTGLLGPLFSLLGSLRAGISGSKEWMVSVRSSIRNRFGEFAQIFNEFVSEANIALRKEGIAQEVLFIIDGIEKTMTADLRRKIIIEDANRLQQIKAYTLFTLPIELMKERPKLKQFSEVEAFPFVKIRHKDGSLNDVAVARFMGFVHQRIDAKLFAEEEIVKEMILLSGGSPRQLLNILAQASYQVESLNGKIDQTAFLEAKRRLVNEAALYLTREKIECLKELKEANDRNQQIEFGPVLELLLEDLVVMEYNDNTFKRVNPLVEASDIYQQQVLGVRPQH